MTQAEYNAFVQDAQAFAIAAGLEHRVATSYDDQDRLYGSVQIFWEGWKEVAAEWRAMTPECRRVTWPDTLARIQYEAAGELSR